MLQEYMDEYTDSFWIIPEQPSGSRVWAHKLLHLKSKGNFYSAQTSTHYILRLIIRGQGSILINKTTYEITHGMMFCTTPGTFIEMQDTPYDPWEWLEIQLSGEDAEKIIQAIGFTRNRPAVTVADRKPAQTLRKMLMYYRRQDRKPYKAISLLYEFVDFCISEQSPAEQDNEYASLISMAQSIIESQSRCEMNVNDLAVRLRVDRSTLFRAFRQELQITPSEYLTLKRMSHAKNLLLSTELKISVIASTCGFCCDKYFINWFHKHNRISPAQWRKEESADSIQTKDQ